ncbi:MAG TPA: hypothetical protein VLQ45_07750 [Thermoanaerobaculia bacterium]|nr:hypothetical protein [Thermoanaerobaculia bacterium]
MAQRRGGRLAAGLAATLLLALAPGAQAQARPAAGWEALWTRLAAWMERLAPENAPAAKCDHGSSIDPNGCPRPTAAVPEGGDHGLSIDPNG